MALIGLIPAAGKGSRLSPLPFSKELYPIGYQDFEVEGETKKRPKVVSQYLVNHFRSVGVEKLIITLGPGKQDIMEYYGAGSRFDMDIVYNFQRVARGMPFALDTSFRWLNEQDTVIFGMSDTIIEPVNSFVQMLDFHNKSNADLTIGLFHTDNPQKFGMVDYDLKTFDVRSTIDKPKETKLTHMWGCCIWNFRFASLMHDHCLQATQSTEANELVFGDIINSAIKKNFRVMGFPIDNGKYIDIGTIEDLDYALRSFTL